MSSFIFQLPLQLFFLECHQLEQESIPAMHNRNEPMKEEETNEQIQVHGKDVEQGPDEIEEVHGLPDKNDPEQPLETTLSVASGSQSQNQTLPLSAWLDFVQRGDIWKKIIVQVLRNPVLCAIVVGFILSLSTVGPRFLNESSNDFVPGLGWISITLSWIGQCVSPVSLFSMGLWMQKECRSLFTITIWTAILFMVAKLVLVPLVMVGLAKAVHLDDQTARAAVLIASLPISQASFVLGDRYKIGQAVLSENVALGTLLILPTILIWNVVMDEFGLFPLPEAES